MFKSGRQDHKRDTAYDNIWQIIPKTINITKIRGLRKKIKTWFLFSRIFGNWVHKNLPRLSPDRVKYRHIYDHRGGQIRPNIQCPNPDLSRNINWSKFVWRWRHHDFEPENSRWSKYYWPLATRLPLNLRMMIMTFAIF